MSRQDIERLQAGYAAFNRGDRATWPATFEAFLHESFELRDPTLPELDQSQRGPAALLDSLDQMQQAFEDVRFELEDVIDLGSRILARVKASGRGKHSGLGIGGTMGHLWWMSEGKALRLEVYEDWDLALAAIGRQRGSGG